MPPTSEMRIFWFLMIFVRGRCDNDTFLDDAHLTSPLDNLPSVEDDNKTDAPLDLFKWRDIDLRRHKGRDVWVWDLYCHMQPVKGDCKEDLKRFYYDAQLDTCTTFSYSGCKGNHNNFESALDCERRCKGANFMGVNENTLPTVCYLQADSGLCLAFATNYYYDVNEQKCKQFTYGGCGGNLNRFETQADCEEHCT